MFVRVMENGRFLGRAGLEQHTRALQSFEGGPYFLPGTRLGQTGLRSSVHYADEVRSAFRKLIRFAQNTGFVLQVFVTAADSKALGRAGLVWRYGASTSYIINAQGEVK